MAKSDRRNAGMVHLIAFSEDGSVVEERMITHEEYYVDMNELIDSNKYRSERQITTVRGIVYDGDGDEGQVFESRYDRAGQYLSGRAVYSDGTVIED